MAHLGGKGLRKRDGQLGPVNFPTQRRYRQSKITQGKRVNNGRKSNYSRAFVVYYTRTIFKMLLKENFV